MYTMTKNTLTTTLGAVLFATFATGTSASAREAVLTLNERAAQNTIVDTAQSRPIPDDASVGALAHNEGAAQRVFIDASTSISARVGVTMREATLSHNEIAAQHAIADASASETAAIGRIGASFGAASSSPAASR